MFLLAHVLLLSFNSFVPRVMPMSIKKGSLWLAYELENPHLVEAFLPDGYALCKCGLLCEDGIRKNRLLYNLYNIDSPFMKGTRLEVMTIAQNRDGRKSFVVLDCMSNTLHWTPTQGIMLPNALGYTRLVDDVVDATFVTTRGLFRYRGKTDARKRPRRDFVVDSNKHCFFRDVEMPVVLDFDNEQVSQSVRTLNTLHEVVLPWRFVTGKQTHAFVHEFDMDYNATFGG